MNSGTAQRVTPQIIFGLGIIAIGVVLLLHNMDIIHAPSYLSYWPVIVILIGLASALAGYAIGSLFGVKGGT